MTDQLPSKGTTKDLSRLDEKGRCCGRKPIFYKGGSWRSPPNAPMHFCCDCHREFSPDGNQIENWAWKQFEPGKFEERNKTVNALVRLQS